MFGDLAILRDGAAALGLPLDDDQIEQFRRYGESLLATNEQMNLTAITDPSQVEILHFLDALTLLPAIRAWCTAHNIVDPTLIDVGSGAGVPGIPLKIALPALRVTLLDATGKRVAFLQRVVEELGLRGIGAYQGRAEEVGRDREWREQFDLVTARAVARLPTLLEWCLPLVRVGGLLLAPKAGDLAIEMLEGERAAPMLGGHVRALRPVELPELPGRALVLVDKTGRTPPRYPRGGGLPTKEPLGMVGVR
ncbi:MAG: 16S rRNA (guanine(527)-N(7))-methyltransferase RsmG [Chloroflexia bacterium]